MTATVLNAILVKFKNKIPETSSLLTTNVFNTKIEEVENEIPDHAKYITTQEFDMFTSENVATRLKEGDLVSKTDFDNKLISFNRKVTSNKTKYLEVQKKLNNLITKD